MGNLVTMQQTGLDTQEMTSSPTTLRSKLMRKVTRQSVLCPHRILMVTAKEVDREETVAERAGAVQHQTEDHLHLTVSQMAKLDTPIPPTYHHFRRSSVQW